MSTLHLNPSYTHQPAGDREFFKARGTKLYGGWAG